MTSSETKISGPLLSDIIGEMDNNSCHPFRVIKKIGLLQPAVPQKYGVG